MVRQGQYTLYLFTQAAIAGEKNSPAEKIKKQTRKLDLVREVVEI